MYMSKSLSDSFCEQDILFGSFEILLFVKGEELYKTNLLRVSKKKRKLKVTFNIVLDLIENLLSNNIDEIQLTLNSKTLLKSNSIISVDIKKNDNYYIAKCLIESIEE